MLQLILATDMARHKDILESLQNNIKKFEWENKSHMDSVIWISSNPVPCLLPLNSFHSFIYNLPISKFPFLAVWISFFFFYQFISSNYKPSTYRYINFFIFMNLVILHTLHCIIWYNCTTDSLLAWNVACFVLFWSYINIKSNVAR